MKISNVLASKDVEMRVYQGRKKTRCEVALLRGQK